MNKIVRFVAALALAATLCTTAAFAQMAPAKAHVKGYTKTLKSGKMVKVKGYNRMKMPQMAHVKGYTKTLKSGKTVQVKGYSRKMAPKGMMKKRM
jgi:hypothetical protein